jgi:outer membrane protein assembly factor BamD
MAAALLAVTACKPDFLLKNYTTNEALYTASLTAYQHQRWSDAITGFDKLSTDLPPRDTLLARSYWYLATAHEKQNEHLLAAQSYSRLVESFPDDTLADDAALEAARAYREMWRKPQLDATYGETALSSYATLTELYPQSPLVPVANKEIQQLQDWFAEKSYLSGMYYFRRKAWDSANLYFTEILTKWPNAPRARDAALRLVESYKSIHYREDAAELCAKLKQREPKAHDIAELCKDVPAVAVPDSTAAKPAAAGGGVPAQRR